MVIANLDRPASVLIAGASKGIGLAFSRLLAANPAVSLLFLLSRHATRSEELRLLQTSFPAKIFLIDCDTTDEADLNEAAASVQRRTTLLHLMINTVGILHDDAMQPEKALGQITLSNLQRAFATNACSGILLAKAFLPWLKPAHPVVFASLSARVGSIDDNRSGGWYSYRASKAAHNQLMKTLSIELARLNANAIVLSLHPGTTETALSQPFRLNVPPSRLFTPEFSAGALMKIISQALPSDTGNFYAWDGEKIAW